MDEPVCLVCRRVPFATGYLAHLGILARSAKPIFRGSLPLPEELNAIAEKERAALGTPLPIRHE
jgi:hypothetical protein